MLLTIVANCVVMAMEVHLPNKDTVERNERLEQMEVYFLGVFCVEMMLKILASGFVFHAHAYLRWNFFFCADNLTLQDILTRSVSLSVFHLVVSQSRQ